MKMGTVVGEFTLHIKVFGRVSVGEKAEFGNNVDGLGQVGV